MNVDKMYFDKFCCICMDKSDLKHLFDEDDDGVSHYNKLIFSIVEMNFKEMNDQRLICEECCLTLNTVYNFRQMCLRSKTNLIIYISQLQMANHIGGSNPQIITTEKENIGISGSVKKEFESEYDDSAAHEEATVDRNGSAHSDVKVEDVEHQTLMTDYSECYTEFNKIEIEEHQLEMKKEPMSDTEITQDGSTSHAGAGTSEEPDESGATKIRTKFTQNNKKDNEGLQQCEIYQTSFNGKDSSHHMQIHSSINTFECEICKKSFKHKNNLTKHMKIHSSKRSHECEICKKSFILKGYLINHMKSHSSERPYECKICKKGFSFKGNLIIHMETHSSERPYECEICKKSFILKGYLINHMKTHSSERPYECKICKKGFSFKGRLLIHMNTHSSERLYECEICKKGFNFKWNLTAHMETHSSERPYECEICKKGFKYKNNLIVHMKTHASERSYECEICKKGFNVKSYLTKHMKSHSNVIPHK